MDVLFNFGKISFNIFKFVTHLYSQKGNIGSNYKNETSRNLIGVLEDYPEPEKSERNGVLRLLSYRLAQVNDTYKSN